MEQIVQKAIKVITETTRYTPYQVMRVIEIAAKYGEKAKFHMTKKQNDILNKLMYLFGADTKWENKQ